MNRPSSAWRQGRPPRSRPRGAADRDGHPISTARALDRAFHSPMMEPGHRAIPRARRAAWRVDQLRIPMVSTIDGDVDHRGRARRSRATGRRHLARRSASPTRSACSSPAAGHDPGRGRTGQTLAALVRQRTRPRMTEIVIPSSTLPHRGAKATKRATLGGPSAEAWTAGVDVDLSAANGGPRTRGSRSRRTRSPGSAIGSSGPPAAATAPLPVARPSRPSRARRGGLQRAAGRGSPSAARTASPARSPWTLAEMSELRMAVLQPGATFTELGSTRSS